MSETKIAPTSIKIVVSDTYSIRRAELQLTKGITVLAGKNGCGKSQLLMAIAKTAGGLNFKQYGFSAEPKSTATVEPTPKQVLWRPPIRKIGESSRNSMFANLTSTESYINAETRIGYTRNVDARYSQLHDRLTHIFVASKFPSGELDTPSIWERIQQSFKRVFDQTLKGEYKAAKGGRVGVEIESGEISSFATLSSGELEYLGLFCDLLTDPDVDLFLIDEIDVHFHPDLQMQVIKEIDALCQECFVLAVTHSPAVMLSVPPQNLLYMKHKDEVWKTSAKGKKEDQDQENGKQKDGVEKSNNQIFRVANDMELLDHLTELYGGFAADDRMATLFAETTTRELLAYANECSKPSESLGKEEARDSDPQICSLRSCLLDLAPNSMVVEIGAGKGRMLAAFDCIEEETLKTIDYVGIDINEKNLAQLKQTATELGLHSRLKSLNTQNASVKTPDFDLCILANVLHEIDTGKLSGFLKRILQSAKRESKVLILEATELAVGEERYVLFAADDLSALFQRTIANGWITFRAATPRSHSGTPLLEAIIKKTDDYVDIDDDDVVRGLQSIISNTADELARNIRDQTHTEARKLAFRCHNIANATAYKQILDTA